MTLATLQSSLIDWGWQVLRSLVVYTTLLCKPQHSMHEQAKILSLSGRPAAVGPSNAVNHGMAYMTCQAVCTPSAPEPTHSIP